VNNTQNNRKNKKGARFFETQCRHAIQMNILLKCRPILTRIAGEETF